MVDIVVLGAANVCLRRYPPGATIKTYTTIFSSVFLLPVEHGTDAADGGDGPASTKLVPDTIRCRKNGGWDFPSFVKEAVPPKIGTRYFFVDAASNVFGNRSRIEADAAGLAGMFNNPGVHLVRGILLGCRSGPKVDDVTTIRILVVWSANDVARILIGILEKNGLGIGRRDRPKIRI